MPLECVVDIYHGNKVVDFKHLDNAGVDAIIEKCTQGYKFADDKYAGRKQLWEQEMGKLFAAYHLCSSCPNDAYVGNQVNHFLSHVGDYSKMTLWLDYEDGGSGLMTWHQALMFVKKIQEKTKRPCGIYASAVIWKDVDLNELPDGCLIWVAQYNKHISKPQHPERWDIWQNTDSGKIEHEPGTFDFDIVNVNDVEGLYKMWDVPYGTAEVEVTEITPVPADEGTNKALVETKVPNVVNLHEVIDNKQPPPGTLIPSSEPFTNQDVTNPNNTINS